MTQIFVHHDPTVVGLYQSIVAEAGIPCFVRDEVNLDVLATIPLPAHSPSLRVTPHEDAERAVAIIREFHRTVATEISTHGTDWVCPQCGETVPASFGSCWKCQAVRPDAA